jgi:hypothetical protein
MARLAFLSAALAFLGSVAGQSLYIYNKFVCYSTEETYNHGLHELFQAVAIQLPPIRPSALLQTSTLFRLILELLPPSLRTMSALVRPQIYATYERLLNLLSFLAVNFYTGCTDKTATTCKTGGGKHHPFFCTSLKYL